MRQVQQRLVVWENVVRRPAVTSAIQWGHQGAPGAPFVRAVLVLGGDAPTEVELGEVEQADLVVASDSGAAALFHHDLVPDRLVGDLDSLDPALLECAVARGVRVDRHPHEKAETDGELALEAVLAETPERLVIIGGHGGRSAMFLTHIRLLRKAAEAGVDATMRGHGETLRVLLPGGRLVSAAKVLDLIALEPALVTLEGLHYSGTVALPPWTGKGVSNDRVAEEAVVLVQEGVVLVVEEHH